MVVEGERTGWGGGGGNIVVKHKQLKGPNRCHDFDVC